MIFVAGIAFFVGGATMLGAVLGFFVKTGEGRANGAVLAFAGGIMTAAAVLELIRPATAGQPALSVLLLTATMLSGAVFMWLLEKSASCFRRVFGRLLLPEGIQESRLPAVKRALLFVFAIAVHNLPEGLAAGFACAADGKSRAFSVALGIALQNIPEGMVLIRPMLSAGLPASRTLFLACATGWIEIVGVFVGRALAAAPFSFLPYLLVFAGGTMLYIVNAEVVPEAAKQGGPHIAGFGFLIGCGFMLLFEQIA